VGTSFLRETGRGDRPSHVRLDGRPDSWILPWAILPEVDYPVAAHLGAKAQQAFLADVADGSLLVEWGRDEDLDGQTDSPALRIARSGAVDAVVIATAERVAAEAIATLDMRHFAAVAIKGHPRLPPRDR
jgi:predicted nucleic acid-binding protein